MTAHRLVLELGQARLRAIEVRFATLPKYKTAAGGTNVEYQKIDVRNQRTKWGSCSTTGTLGLN